MGPELSGERGDGEEEEEEAAGADGDEYENGEEPWDPVLNAISSLDEFYTDFAARHEEIREEAVDVASAVGDDANARHLRVAAALRLLLREMAAQLGEIELDLTHDMDQIYGSEDVLNSYEGDTVLVDPTSSSSAVGSCTPNLSPRLKFLEKPGFIITKNARPEEVPARQSDFDKDAGRTVRDEEAGTARCQVGESYEGAKAREDAARIIQDWEASVRDGGTLDDADADFGASEPPPLLDCRSLSSFPAAPVFENGCPSSNLTPVPKAVSAPVTPSQGALERLLDEPVKETGNSPESRSPDTFGSPASLSADRSVSVDGLSPFVSMLSSQLDQPAEELNPSSEAVSPGARDSPSSMSALDSAPIEGLSSFMSMLITSSEVLEETCGSTSSQRPHSVASSSSDHQSSAHHSSDDVVGSEQMPSPEESRSEKIPVALDLGHLIRETVGSPASEETENKAGTGKQKEEENTSEDEDEGQDDEEEKAEKKSGRRNIRKFINDDSLDEATVEAAKEEEERLARIKELEESLTKAVKEEKSQFVLDVDGDDEIAIDPGLALWLKPHQVEGVKFMYRATMENMKVASVRPGAGCILAHCMGLGKSLQVVTFAHTILTAQLRLGVKRVLVLCPYNVILNWLNEFRSWLSKAESPGAAELVPRVSCIAREKTPDARLVAVEKWFADGGVLIMGYDMFRLLASAELHAAKLQQQQLLQQQGHGAKAQKKILSGEQWQSFVRCLLNPGPDVVVCDEGHLLKNEETKLFKCLRTVRTRRRIVLTGTPLQNNLKEYHCMVQFVKPNLLGTLKEFTNRFVNPIINGQWEDSTPEDVKIMKQRAHVLFNLLRGCVQRRDYSVLSPFLPPKNEYVIAVRLSPVQIQLYDLYLENLRKSGALRQQGVESPNRMSFRNRLFADFVALSQICCHPLALRLAKDKYKNKTTVTLEKDDDESLTSFTQLETEAKAEIRDWWQGHLSEADVTDWSAGGKLVLLRALIQECEKVGDKILVFSQSLLTLDVVEACLHADEWAAGVDYFRIDGSTSVQLRSKYVDDFNAETNQKVKVVLISTRAGSLGINLVAANRVVILDACWNPTHDVQAIFRAYRFGQKKPVFVYRFLAKGTLEEKIYERQVTKLSLSCRVVDELQVDRHYANSRLSELYKFNPDRPKSDEEEEILQFPQSDMVLAELLSTSRQWVSNFHEHDSLLTNREDEGLSEEERRTAWAEYEREKRNPVKWINGPGGPIRVPVNNVPPGMVPANAWGNPWGGDQASMQERAFRFFIHQKKCGRYPHGCSGSLSGWDEHFVCPRCRNCSEAEPCSICAKWSKAVWLGFNNRDTWEAEYPTNRDVARNIVSFYYLKTQQKRPPNFGPPLTAPGFRGRPHWQRGHPGPRGGGSGLVSLASKVPEIHRRIPELNNGMIEVTVARKGGQQVSPGRFLAASRGGSRIPGRPPQLRPPGPGGPVGPNPRPNPGQSQQMGLKRPWSFADSLAAGDEFNAKSRRTQLQPRGLNSPLRPPTPQTLPLSHSMTDLRRTQVRGVGRILSTGRPVAPNDGPFEVQFGNMVLRKATRKPPEPQPPTVVMINDD